MKAIIQLINKYDHKNCKNKPFCSKPLKSILNIQNNKLNISYTYTYSFKWLIFIYVFFSFHKNNDQLQQLYF